MKTPLALVLDVTPRLERYGCCFVPITKEKGVAAQASADNLIELALHACCIYIPFFCSAFLRSSFCYFWQASSHTPFCSDRRSMNGICMDIDT